MDIKSEVERLVNNSSFLEVMLTTIPFLQHLKLNNISPTETVFKHYVNHVLSNPNIYNEKKEEIEFILRDHFSCFSNRVATQAIEKSKPAVAKKEPPATKHEPDDDEITDEFIAKLRGDEPEVQEPEPPDWFLELYKIGKDTEDV